MKDVNVSNIIIKVNYESPVDCAKVNIFHNKLINASCKAFKSATLANGSPINGNDCHYELQCNHGDVVCGVELIMIDQHDNFSICEIM